MSLLAIKRGEVHLPYDGRFVFAEVNADKVYWVVNEDRSMDVKGIRKDRLGFLLMYSLKVFRHTLWSCLWSTVFARMNNSQQHDMHFPVLTL